MYRFTQINSSVCNTPKKLSISSASSAAVRNANEQVQTKDHLPAEGQLHVSDKSVQRQSGSKRDLFSTSFDSTCSQRSFGIDMSPFKGSECNVSTSTPVRSSNTSVVTGGFLKNTTAKKSAEKPKNRSMCLGDFITTSKPRRKSAPVLERPKKRVVPITISKVVSNDFSNPSFKSSNNLLEVEEVPVERDLLKTHRELITKDFFEDQPVADLKTLLKDKLVPASSSPKAEVDLSKIEADMQRTLDRLACVFSLLMDRNLVINVLSELAYLINLTNLESEISDSSTQFDSVLKDLNRCVSFALASLDRQRHLLAQLDTTTIKVLIENERLSKYRPTLTAYLAESHARKFAPISTTRDELWLEAENNLLGASSGGLTHVIYQQEDDNADNFPTGRESAAFRSQRDIFYDVLRTWENRHLSSSFSFTVELRPKVKSLFSVIDHPINMAHLAKLFTAQLIISCNFDHSASELQMELPNIDLTKLSKLQERFSAPSAFSTEYLFPGNQTFFRDFIVAAENNAVFMEQLKVALVAKLVEMNDSAGVVVPHLPERVARPDSVATMRVLAKFIGFVISRPFTFDGPGRNKNVSERQIAIRNVLSPTFDIKPIIHKAIIDHRLSIAVPWLVQYLSMLDYVTLRLDYYQQVLQTLFELYIASPSMVQPTKFVVRVCLGWLFDHPNVPKDYYTYRQHRVRHVPMIEAAKTKTSSEVAVRDSPLLEAIVVASCPFLSDFRVAIMPKNWEKQVSRTGQYRHIRTKLAEEPAAMKNEEVTDNQGKLLNVFLQGQSPSVRKIIDFVIERVTSAVIKDFQMEQLIPKKRAVVEALKEMKAVNEKSAIAVLKTFYPKSLAELNAVWNDATPKAIKVRTNEAFASLLPKETIEGVRNICIEFATSKILAKTDAWRLEHMTKIEVFSSNIRSDARVLVNNNKSDDSQAHTNFVIKLDSCPPSGFFYEFQKTLQKLSIRPETVEREAIDELLERNMHVLQTQIFTSNANRLCALSIFHLLQLLIARRPELVDDKLIGKCIRIWKLDIMKPFITPARMKDECNTSESEENAVKSPDKERPRGQNYIFAHFISPRFILLLDSDKSVQKISVLLKALIRENFLLMDLLSDNVVSLLRHEWRQDKMELIHSLSWMLQNIDKSDEQAHLFLDFVSDFTRDIDDFSN